MSEKTEIMLGQERVVLDPALLTFNEATLGQFMEEAAGFYNYYGRVFADLEAAAAAREYDYEVKYAEAYKAAKLENGYTEKVCEAAAKLDPQVQEAHKLWIYAKHKMRLVQQHLKAWDKAHENALNRGYTLRKEMDKLHQTRVLDNSVSLGKLDDIVRDSEEQLKDLR